VSAVAIRPEEPRDADATRRVLELAFGAGASEADLVEALRAAGDHVPELCLVAVAGEGEVVGHLFFSRARLASGHDVLALAPMAVVPERQRQGVGAQLVEDGLERAARTAFPLVVVLGHPEYYPRFGFEPAAAFGVTAPWEVPPEAWMAKPLPAYRPQARGLVAYPPAFGAVTG
jgi:putative acetyltransferase